MVVGAFVVGLSQISSFFFWYSLIDPGSFVVVVGGTAIKT